MSIEIEGIFLSLDLTDLISETFAKRMYIDLSKWVQPYCYFDERNQSLITNGDTPDGIYVLIGRMSYPGNILPSYFTIYQFNIVKIVGLNITLARPLNPYPNMPNELRDVAPVYPLFRVGETFEYRQAIALYNKIIKQHLTADALRNIIFQSDENSIESKIYRIRLAVQRQIEREQERWI